MHPLKAFLGKVVGVELKIPIVEEVRLVLVRPLDAIHNTSTGKPCIVKLPLRSLMMSAETLAHLLK